MISTPLPEEFAQHLLAIEDILHKHKLVQFKEMKIEEYKKMNGKNSRKI